MATFRCAKLDAAGWYMLNDNLYQQNWAVLPSNEVELRLLEGGSVALEADNIDGALILTPEDVKEIYGYLKAGGWL